MSHKINLVRVLTAATGNSSPIQLDNAYSQLFMTPAEAGAMNGRTYSYFIVDGNNWEYGRGVYTSSGTTLARNVIASRSGGTLGTSRINLTGTAQVRFVELAEDMDGVRGTRAVTGTSDTLNNSDLGYAVTYSNASAVAVSLAQAGASNLFLDGWAVFVKNKGAGAVSITPATSTIDGAATLVLQQGQAAMIWSDGTNYQAIKFGVVVGTTAGTVAAGDDARIVGAVRSDTSQSIAASAQLQARLNISAALKNHIVGLTCSNNATDATNDIDIAVGEAASTETNPVLMVLASALTKQLDATWAVGNNAGGRESGDTLGNKTYHVWLIQRSDTGVVDVLFSASATSPTMPTNYDRKRLIWSIVRTGGAILPFTQRLDECFWKTPRNDLSAAPSTSTVLRALSVPTGISVKAKFTAWYFTTSASASGQVYFSCPLDVDDIVATGSLFSLAGLIIGSSFSASGTFEVSTDTSGQIRSNANYSDGSTSLRLTTIGFTHSRGRV